MNLKKLFFEMDVLDAVGLGRWSRRKRILESAPPTHKRKSFRRKMAGGPLLFVPTWKRTRIRNHAISQIRAMVACNAPLPEGLERCADQAPDVATMAVLLVISRHLRRGLTLAEALIRLPSVFPRHYADLIAVGEETGTLLTVLDTLHEHSQEARPIRVSLASWALYFSFLALFFSLIGIVVWLRVIPQYDEVSGEFAASTAQIAEPENLKTILDYFLNSLTILAIALLPLFFYRVRRMYAAFFMWIAHGLPFFRRMAVSVSMAHATGVLGRYLQVDVPLNEALARCGNLHVGARYRRAFKRMGERVEQGDSFAVAVEGERSLPKSFGVLMRLGETSGSLPDMVMHASEWYRLIAVRYATIFVRSICPLGILVFAAATLCIQLTVYNYNIGLADALASPEAARNAGYQEVQSP